MEKIVSIITPCFNGEDYISRYLNSILEQTHKNIELIFINDGSKDRTEEIVMSYKPKFKEREINLKYIYQENMGQAAAINQGLKIFKGDYLTWPDSDDILSVDSIEKKVKFLEEHLEFGLVRSDAKIVKENNLSKVTSFFAKENPNKFKEELFLDFVTENKVWFAPGCYMVRSSAFLDVNLDRTIYPSRAGQNWQLYLPILYKYKCGFINESLYTYVIRSDSHSHSVRKFNDQLSRCDDHEDILIKTINTIDMARKERQKYTKIIEEKYIRKRLYLAIQLKDLLLVEKEFQLLSSADYTNRKDKILYFLAKSNLYHSVKKIKNVLSAIFRNIFKLAFVSANNKGWKL